MYRTTIKGAFGNEMDITTEEMESLNGPQIYVVRDGDVIFYVGRSVDPFRRIYQHMGYEMKLPSSLGRLILNNQPESDKWIFECHNLEDCLPLINQSLPKEWNEETKALALRGCRIDPSKAEDCMIQALSPCLNTSHNNNPNSLPEKYRRYPTQSSAQYLRE